MHQQCNESTAPSILNNLKLPHFMRSLRSAEGRYTAKSNEFSNHSGHTYKYVLKPPPSIKDLLQSPIANFDRAGHLFIDEEKGRSVIASGKEEAQASELELRFFPSRALLRFFGGIRTLLRTWCLSVLRSSRMVVRTCWQTPK